MEEPKFGISGKGLKDIFSIVKLLKATANTSYEN